MAKAKAEIVIRISLKDTGLKKELEAMVDVAGSDHEVMEIAEIAQQLTLLGEASMERILIRVLNEDPKLIGASERFVN